MWQQIPNHLYWCQWSRSETCQQTSSSLRGDDGVWTEFHAEDVDGNSIKIYPKADSSPQQEAIEAKLRHIKRAVAQLDKRTARVQREERTISVNWTPICKVESSEKDVFKILWNYTALTKLGLDKELITAKLEDGGTGRATSSIEWCP